MAISTYASANIRAYFQSKRAGIDAQLVARVVEFIGATQATLDCAIYDLRHPEILAALARVAAKPHVRLRIAFDASGERNGAGLTGDPKPSGTHQAIADAGLLERATPIHEHGRHLMHDKFLVRDGREVWVGSANMTVGGLELQDNNCLAIASQPLAARYTATFEELISPNHQHEDSRHAKAQSSPPPAPVNVDGAQITPYFAPAAGEGIEQALIGAIRQARRIRIFAFLLGDPGILEALAPLATNHTFDIRGIYDPHGMQDVMRTGGHAGHAGKSAHATPDDSRFWFVHDKRFIAAPTHGFAPGREQDFMHNKVMIIDDRMVFTGSYNFSENAEDNDETLLAIDSPALAEAYTAYFDALEAAYGGVRQPVAAATVASTGAAVGAGAVAIAERGHAGSQDVVDQLRREHSRNQPTRERAPAARGARVAKAGRHERVSRAKGNPSALDGPIGAVLTLLLLTALALIAFVALTLAGVLFH